jgi:alpha-D-ribose 1-methylphosphonate 5-triphosphate synthase subunit PhnG
MAILARMDGEELACATDIVTSHFSAPFRLLRGPETGLTMLRGRAGGEGAAFNLGEATVTRCSVVLEDGTIGHSWRLGRDKAAAQAAAWLDALLQSHPDRDSLFARVIAPAAERQRARAEAKARRAAATEVRFATLAAMR